MKKIILITLSFLSILGNVVAASNIPQVPSKMTFAGIELKLNKAAQNKIQKYVNDLRYSDKYFQRLVDKADIYFPIIEKAFKEEQFPDDVKYLIIQESAFKADAVSSSKAVGYWQFKAATAREVGLRVDGKIDERKNIEAASKAAARYMTKNNTRLQNWVYAIISYNTGLGGVQKYYKIKDKGAKRMDITQRTHWYVLKCIAHKIAYQDAVHKKNPSIALTSIVKSNTNIKTIAKEYGVSLDLLNEYNKWISTKRAIPTDKPYTVALPLPYKEGDHKEGVAVANIPDKEGPSNKESSNKHNFPSGPTESENNQEGEDKKKETIKVVTQIGKKKVTSSMEELKERYKINRTIIVNGVPGMVAKYNDNAQRLALLGRLSKKKFIRYNELHAYDVIIPGQTYYYKPKRKKAIASFHTVEENETLWSISQQYGMKQWAIRSKNGMKSSEALQIGRVLWLKKHRPEDQAIEIKNSRTKNSTLSGTLKHTVIKGDTLYKISKKHNVSVEQIKKLNNLSNNGISIGSVLIIK